MFKFLQFIYIIGRFFNRGCGGYYYAIKCDKHHQWISFLSSKLFYNNYSLCIFRCFAGSTVAYVANQLSFLVPSLSFSLFFFFLLLLLLQMRAYYQTSVSYYTNGSMSTITIHSAWSHMEKVPLIDLCGTNQSQLLQNTSGEVSSQDIFFSMSNTVITTQSNPLPHSSSLLPLPPETYNFKMSYSIYILPSPTATSFLTIELTSTSHFSAGLAHGVFTDASS